MITPSRPVFALLMLLAVPALRAHEVALEMLQASARFRASLDAAQLKLATYPLTDAERETIRQAMFRMAELLETEEDAQALRIQSAELSSATGEFAARRMNASINQALAGRSLESL